MICAIWRKTARGLTATPVRLLQSPQTSVESEVSSVQFVHVPDGRECIFLDSCPDIVSSAKFVLIVEKDATFQRLLDSGFCTQLSPCIIITVCFPGFGLFMIQMTCLEFCFCLCPSGERCARCQHQVDGAKALGQAPHPHLCAGGCRPSRWAQSVSSSPTCLV